MTDTHTFNPSQHLVNLKGKDYLEVKWRLVWLRDVYPDAEISTELVEHHPGQGAVVRAFVKTPAGGIATGYGSETKGDFNDYLEKAETKAIGRALAALGFGTQFCDDFVFGAEQGRVVDSPVANGNGHAPQNLPPRGRTEGHNTMPANGNGQRPQIQNPDAPASDKQIGFIRSLAKDHGFKFIGPDGDEHTDEVALTSIIGAEYEADWPNINKATASRAIEDFQAGKFKR